MKFFSRQRTSVIEVVNPFSDYYLLKVEVPPGFHWNPGQATTLHLKGQFRGRRWRIFSIASIKQEGYLLFGTKTGDFPSEFKKRLMNLKPYEEVCIDKPIGNFSFTSRRKPIILVSFGIGITPVLSILKANHHSDIDIHIVYATTKICLFRDEIDKILSRNPFLRVTYSKSRFETQNELSQLVLRYGNDANYFISGSNQFVKTIKKFLKDHKIKKRFMFDNLLTGYN